MCAILDASEDEPIQISDDEQGIAVPASAKKKGAVGGQGGKRKPPAPANKATGPAERKAAMGAKRAAAAQAHPLLNTLTEGGMEIDRNGNGGAHPNSTQAGAVGSQGTRMGSEKAEEPQGFAVFAANSVSPTANNSINSPNLGPKPDICIPAPLADAALNFPAGVTSCGASPVEAQTRPKRQQQQQKKFYEQTESALTRQREQREQQQPQKLEVAGTGSAYDFNAAPSTVLAAGSTAAALLNSPGAHKTKHPITDAAPSQKKVAFAGKVSSMHDATQAVSGALDWWTPPAR